MSNLYIHSTFNHSMQKLSFNKGTAKVKVENLDDLWYLSQLVDQGDIVRGRTYRKIKRGGDGEKGSVDKKPITLTLQAEKIEFTQDTLRINGKVTEPKEDIPKGSHHTLTVEEGYQLTLIKEQWLSYQLDKFKEATSSKGKKILVLVLDREEAFIALTKRRGYDIIVSLQGEAQKKDDRAQTKGSFFADVAKALQEYDKRYKTEHIIVASPAFWKDEFMKMVDAEIKKKIVLATCHSAEENAIQEVLKRPEVQTVLHEERITKETQLVEKLLSAIARDSKVTYGFKHVKEAAEQGAVATLIVTDHLIQKRREDNSFEPLEEMMKLVDNTKGEVHLISTTHEAGKKLQGLGGIAALLRYSLP